MGITGLCISLMISRLFLFIGQRKILANLMKAGVGTVFGFNFRPFLASGLLLGMAVWLAMNTGSIGIWQLLFYAPAAFAGTLVVFYFLGLSKADRLELQQIATSIKFFRSDKGFSKN